MEQDAATLRNSSAWKSWLRSIRDYASSDGVKGTREAAILADAMEQHGCDILHYGFGGCFSWADRLGWDFKTVEFFCPETCGCKSTNMMNSACPRPFGMDCERIRWACLTLNNQHYCPDWNAKRILTSVIYVAHAAARPLVKLLSRTCSVLREQYGDQLTVAFRMTFVQITGLNTSFVRSDEMFSTDTVALGDIWLIDGQNKTAMEELINGLTPEDYQARQLRVSSRCILQSTV